jgi:hypothetical protein
MKGDRIMETDELSDSRVGRPTKYSQETIARLCAALADGLPIKGACVVAGIGVTTLAEWREQHPGLEERMSEAREIARQKALRSITAAGEKDWRAHAEWLKLAFPADYRGSANKIEVSAIAVSGTVLSEDERVRLIERRDKALLALASKSGETA